MLETLSDLSEIQTEERKKLEQRVKALEDLIPLEERVTAIEEEHLAPMVLSLFQRVGRLEAATPSPATVLPTTDSPSDVPEQESIPPESLASSRSDQRIIVGGRVGRALKSADPPDAST
jgi:hypothetical protein